MLGRNGGRCALCYFFHYNIFRIEERPVNQTFSRKTTSGECPLIKCWSDTFLQSEFPFVLKSQLNCVHLSGNRPRLVSLPKSSESTVTPSIIAGESLGHSQLSSIRSLLVHDTLTIHRTEWSLSWTKPKISMTVQADSRDCQATAPS